MNLQRIQKNIPLPPRCLPANMEATTPPPPAPSILTDASSATLQTSPSHLLEINIISAQNLPHIYKSMKTYAVAWLNPNRKLTTHVDSKGNSNPYWNEKLYFHVNTEIFYTENLFLTVEIYTIAWFRDVFAGIVKIRLIDLVSLSKEKRLVTLQLRRPGGEPQGILNIGFSLDRSDDENFPMPKNEGNDDQLDEVEKQRRIGIQEKFQYWRSRAVEDLADDEGSVVNPGSVVNGVDVCSDIGPYASIVAVVMARTNRPSLLMFVVLPPRAMHSNVEGDDLGSSILEELTLEEVLARGWMDGAQVKKRVAGGRNRRHSDDNDRLFSCFGNVYDIEVQIVCGNKSVNNSSSKNNHHRTTTTAKPRMSM